MMCSCSPELGIKGFYTKRRDLLDTLGQIPRNLNLKETVFTREVHAITVNKRAFGRACYFPASLRLHETTI